MASRGKGFTLTALTDLVGAVAIGTVAVKIAKKIAKEKELSMLRRYIGGPLGGVERGHDLKTIAKVGAVALLGTYAIFKIAQKIEKKDDPPLPSRYIGGSLEGVEAEGGNNMGALSRKEQGKGRNWCARGGGSVLEEEEPWCLSPGELETWYNENIKLGTDAFARDCRIAVDSVVRHIHRHCSANSLDFDVDKVVKGGSLGKGTMVKDLSDVDLVAFINEPYLKPIAEIGKEEYKRTLSRIIFNMMSTLRDVPNVQMIRFNQYLVNFKIQVNSRWIDVDLLPTTKNVSSLQTYHEMFRSMLEVGHKTRQFYSASLVQHQVQFVKEQPVYVKELINLVKYWASKFLPQSLQKSYPLELITIYRWKIAGRPGRHLSKAQGLKSVLEVLTNLNRLRVSWQGDDLDETIMRRLGMKRPIVLDPANPTNNVCILYQWGNSKEVITAAAAKTLRTTLLRNVPAWPYLRE